MKLETALKGALPRTALERWNDEQLATVFALGVHLSELHQLGNMDRWLNLKDAELDFRYLQAQLGQSGLETSGILTPKIIEGLHGGFDLRPIVAAIQRELKTRQLRKSAIEVLPPLETLRTSEEYGIGRLETFRDVLMRHSYVPSPHSTNPELYRKLQSLNPEGRRVDQINILQLPSIITPPR